MAAELTLVGKFVTVSTSATNGDLIFEYTAEFSDFPLPSAAPELRVSAERRVGAKKAGRLRLLAPDVNGKLADARTLAETTDGVLPELVVAVTPLRGADRLTWRFFIACEPGGKAPTLAVTANAGAAKPVTAPTPPLSSQLPRPTSGSTALPLTPGQFPRFVVGIDTATIPPATLPSPAGADAAAIQACLERVFARLTDANFEASVLGASAAAQGNPGAKVVPSAAQATATSIQDAELAWANQVALMQLCTPYGGPNALYNLNDDDLLARSINSPGGDPEQAVFPIVFACQHLGSFAVASRGRGLLKLNQARTRFMLLPAGANCASVWTETKIGKWMITTPDGAAPLETDGAKGDPSKLAPDEKLETSPLLFQIKDVASTHPFGAAAVFVYANRPVKTDTLCSVVDGNEICLLQNKDGSLRVEDVPVFEEREVVFVGGIKKKKKVLVKNPDGTIKTIRQTARTTWAVSKFTGTGPDGQVIKLLGDQTAGAHVAYVLRVDGQTKLFQTFDTGGINVPKRGSGVELVPPVAGFHGGIFDDPTTDRINPSPTGPDSHDPFRGVGVIERLADASQAQELRKHVEQVLKKARPMGLARLVLLRRGLPITHQNYWRFAEPSQGFLLYASPALPMYDGVVDTHTFPISRCLWALRDFPDAANVEAMWFFYVPQGVLGQAMLEAPRGSRIRAIAQDAFGRLKANDQTKYAGDLQRLSSRLVADFTLPVLNATCEPSGKVKLVATYKTKLLNNRGMSLLHGLEGRYGSRSLLPLDQSFLRAGQSDSAFPAYFRSV